MRTGHDDVNLKARREKPALRGEAVTVLRVRGTLDRAHSRAAAASALRGAHQPRVGLAEISQALNKSQSQFSGVIEQAGFGDAAP